MPRMKTRPSRTKVRKHLNANAFFVTIRGEFKKIPKFRIEKSISIPDAGSVI